MEQEPSAEGEDAMLPPEESWGPHSSEADVTAETHRELTGRGCGALTVCQALREARSCMLCCYNFMRPAEEGSVFSRYQEKKGVTASTMEPGQPRPVLCHI